MRICVISNSHAASLKDGWTSMGNAFPNIEVTFFAAPNRLMDEVNANIKEKKLQTENKTVQNILSFTSGGLNTIDVTQYDAFLVYGLFLSVPRLDSRHSSEVKKATILDSVNSSINYRFVADLCNMTTVPVFYSASPLLSESILNYSIDTTTTYHSYDTLCEWVADHYDYKNALLVKQMDNTMSRDLTTQQAYSKGSVRLTKLPTKHVDHDVMHMNAQYGKLFMTMFLQNELANHLNDSQQVA